MKQNGYNQFFKAARDAKNPQADKSKRPRFAKEKNSDSSRLAFVPSPKRPKGGGIGLTNISFVFLCLGLCAWVFFAPENFEQFIHKFEIRVMGEAQASSEEKPSSSAADHKEKSAETSPGSKPGGSEDKKVFSDEEISHFAKLNERKKDLDQREQELNELEAELHKQRDEIEARIKKLDEMRSQIGQVLKDRVTVDQDRVNKLVEFYSNMKPKQAADIIGKLNEDLAVEILVKMKKKNAAEIMNLLEPAKAQNLSEKFAGYTR